MSSDTQPRRGMSPEEFAKALEEYKRRTGKSHPAILRLVRALAGEAALRDHEAALAEAQRRREKQEWRIPWSQCYANAMIEMDRIAKIVFDEITRLEKTIPLLTNGTMRTSELRGGELVDTTHTELTERTARLAELTVAATDLGLRPPPLKPKPQSG